MNNSNRRRAKERSFHGALALCALLIFLLALIFAGTNTNLRTVRCGISDARIKDELRFVMLSDLHRSVYGKEQCDLIAAVDAERPDAVFFCGDVFDEYGEYDKIRPLLEALGAAYPCYFVSGNHEFYSNITCELRAEYRQMLSECGIVWLASDQTTLTFGETTVDLFGIEDQNRYLVYDPDDEERFRDGNFSADFEALSDKVSNERFSILLCHRPMPDEVRASNFDLVLSGHMHGGQWRFPPLVNGLYTPNQGFFPDYAGGLYHIDDSVLFVGRGLCKTGVVPRFCNRPEVVVIELHPETSGNGE